MNTFRKLTDGSWCIATDDRDDVQPGSTSGARRDQPMRTLARDNARVYCPTPCSPMFVLYGYEYPSFSSWLVPDTWNDEVCR